MFAAVKQRAALWSLPSYTACVQHLAQQIQALLTASSPCRSVYAAIFLVIWHTSFASCLSLHTPVLWLVMLPGVPAMP